MNRPLPTLISKEVMDGMVRLAADSPWGAIVEVGVYRGGSAERLYAVANERSCPLYLYDTFTGIPHQDPSLDRHEVGEFACDNESEIRERLPLATIVKGIFPASAVPMGPIGFVHLDCDQYRSVKESLVYLWPHLLPGGSIWLDDAPLLEGAKKAADEFMQDLTGFSSRMVLDHYVISRHG